MENLQKKLNQLQKLTKRKHISQAKTVFVELIDELYPIVISSYKVLDPSLKNNLNNILEKIYLSYNIIWKHGINLACLSNEVSALFKLMGIHRLLLNHDQAHTFGNLWISLIKKHIGKFKSTPESFNFYEEIHGYFFYLEEFCDKKQLITEIDELLDSTTKRNHEGFANLLSIKAKYVRDLEGDSERSLRLLRESTWIVSQLKTFKNKKNYYANLLGIALIYRVDLNDFEKALKWNLMLFLKISDEEVFSQDWFPIYIDCLLEIITCCIEGYSDVFIAKPWLQLVMRKMSSFPFPTNRQAERERATERLNFFLDQSKLDILLEDNRDEVDDYISDIRELKRNSCSCASPSFVMQKTSALVPKIAASKRIIPETKIALIKEVFDMILDYFLCLDLRLEGARHLKKILQCLPIYRGGRLISSYSIADLLIGGQYFQKALQVLSKAERTSNLCGGDGMLTSNGELLEDKSVNLQIWIRQVQCYKGIKEFKKALILYKKIFDVDPDGNEALVVIPYLYCLMRMRKYSLVKRRIQKTDMERLTFKRQVSLRFFCWISSLKIGEDCSCLTQINIIEWLSSYEDENWIWYLCFQLFDGLKEHFELALPLFTSVLVRKTASVKSLNEDESNSCSKKFNITKNSYCIKEFFREKVILAKNT